jgi:predicted lipoprotein with Yx(FWY)xxD motif
MSRRTVLPALIPAALLAMALAACSSAPDPYSAAAAGAAPATSIAEPDHTVLVANSTAKLGTVVIDAAGWTLYRSDADSAKPPNSTCTGDCATSWPPVLMGSGSPDYEGIDPKLVGTVVRDDGTQQVTIGGWPVYRHADDSKPGSLDGQGAARGWFAVTPTGSKATAPS